MTSASAGGSAKSARNQAAPAERSGREREVPLASPTRQCRESGSTGLWRDPGFPAKQQCQGRRAPLRRLVSGPESVCVALSCRLLNWASCSHLYVERDAAGSTASNFSLTELFYVVRCEVEIFTYRGRRQRSCRFSFFSAFSLLSNFISSICALLAD